MAKMVRYGLLHSIGELLEGGLSRDTMTYGSGLTKGKGLRVMIHL